jgi:hypothetical protein
MQPDSPFPPAADQPTEPSILDDLVALTSLFNPEQIWHEEEILDKLDEQARAEASPAPPTSEPG